MRIILDTNVLCRLSDRGHAMHAATKSAIALLETDGRRLCVIPQVIYEYWVVVTRPAEANGLGMHPTIADQAVTAWLEIFPLLEDEAGVFLSWRSLVRSEEVRGKKAHDARIIAAMERHSVRNLLTFNVTDFAKLHVGLAFASPDQVLEGNAAWHDQ
jgi:predicted nucleic acid-binding protein